MNEIDLSMEELPLIEAPLTTTEGVVMCIGMFSLGVAVGVGIAVLT